MDANSTDFIISSVLGGPARGLRAGVVTAHLHFSFSLSAATRTRLFRYNTLRRQLLDRQMRYRRAHVRVRPSGLNILRARFGPSGRCLRVFANTSVLSPRTDVITGHARRSRAPPRPPHPGPPAARACARSDGIELERTQAILS
ncbi:hypothetical protein EVAR_33238_1 [Eumeta japonica]|uniref:Uncharacterized protein n=1 Tax=Eumeta variegata TaxID=151549 RepID=A0A4C1W265_EUMVA|nr:hypothetical protein EVAR_33238_1 [Eumeta japonica]